MPFGVFYVVGRDFHGFHVRFKDIARGGIRILRSATYDEYQRNADSLFEECFALAFTQNKKNKDIPEGGSKGIILPAFGDREAEAEQAFRSYVDALLRPARARRTGSPSSGGRRRSSSSARTRAPRTSWTGHACAPASAATATGRPSRPGKDAVLGGISHKEYGMTTEGVHRYVLGILRELGIAEETITKVQTGGPDGDLGSNEILVSKDRTIALVDGGGVLYDPDGLARPELVRLARAGRGLLRLRPCAARAAGVPRHRAGPRREPAGRDTRGVGPRVPQHLPPRPAGKGGPLRALRRTAEVDQPLQLALAPGRGGQAAFPMDRRRAPTCSSRRRRG